MENRNRHHRHTLDAALVATSDMAQAIPVTANMASPLSSDTALVITLDVVPDTHPVTASMVSLLSSDTALVITLDAAPVATPMTANMVSPLSADAALVTTLDVAHILRNRWKRRILRYPKNKSQKKLTNSGGTFLPKPFLRIIGTVPQTDPLKNNINIAKN
jgi:hypothetical protein